MRTRNDHVMRRVRALRARRRKKAFAELNARILLAAAMFAIVAVVVSIPRGSINDTMTAQIDPVKEEVTLWERKPEEDRWWEKGVAK